MKSIFCTLASLFFSGLFCLGQAWVDSLDHALQQHYESSQLPGFSVALVSKSGSLYQKGFGYANLESQTPFTAQTLINIGSVSKTLIGVALVKAMEAGLLSFDTEINQILPFAVIHPYHPDVPITVRHLATHKAGILDRHYGNSYLLEEPNALTQENIARDYVHFIRKHTRMELGDFLQQNLVKGGKWYQKKNFAKSAPGTEANYSNLGAALAAYVLEVVCGESFQAYTQSTILNPLGMQASGWKLADIDQQQFANQYFPSGQRVPRYSLITYPDGGFISSTADLSRYLTEIIRGYVGKSSFMSQAAFHHLLPGDKDDSRAFWGMGTQSRLIGHDGSDPGVQTQLAFHADTGIGRIILTNVNAEDDSVLWAQFKEIGQILKRYEKRLGADK